MNSDLKNLCDKLVQLVINIKDKQGRKTLLSIVHRIFDNEDEIYIPGTIGSYIMNCIFNFKQEKEFTNTSDLRNYDDYNFLFYHDLPDRKLFTPIKLEKKNTKSIILINEKDVDSFKLEESERNTLRNMGINLNGPIVLMAYIPSTRTFKELSSINLSNSDVEINKNTLWIAFLIIIVIALVLLLMFLSFRDKGKGKSKKSVV
jgi:hypothetical protein